MSFLFNADWSVLPETRILKCYLNYPIGQLSDFLLPLDPCQVPSLNLIGRREALVADVNRYSKTSLELYHNSRFLVLLDELEQSDRISNA